MPEEHEAVFRPPTEEHEITGHPQRRGPWFLVYEGYDPEAEGLREALCTTANGYFATRGAAPEARADGVHYPGTYAAGVFNRLPTEIAGRTVENESMVNLPNWLPLSFRIEGGPWFDPAEVELLRYQQELDLRRGVLSRRVRFRDAEGRTTRFVQRRFVSMAYRHAAALEMTIEAEDWSGAIELRTGIDGGVENSGVERYRDLAGRHLTAPETSELDPETLALVTTTSQSRLTIAEAARTRLCRDGNRLAPERTLLQEDDGIYHLITCHLEEGQPGTIEKVAVLFTSRDLAISEAAEAAAAEIAALGDFEELLKRHVSRWDEIWERGRLRMIQGERDVFNVNLHLFVLLQTVTSHTMDLDVGVPARGLHGEAYRGHVFWDELFIFPYVSFRMPELARSLLHYRYRRLPAARRAAREAGYSGAMFPWQSASDGTETSQVMHLNPESGRWIEDHTHLQRHINLAVAYNVIHYHRVTGDLTFLAFHGAEIILEVARFWASLADYDRARDRYVIRGVMGPDEYHDAYPDAAEPGLDNNAYTNVMAVWTLWRALEVLAELPPRRRRALSDRLRISREEVELWEHASRRMFVPFHGEGIISQFEGYEKLEEFDWEGYRERYGNIHRLDRILEAEGDTPNRYKASKQADVLMLFYLLSSSELAALFSRLGYPFDHDTIPRNVDYYARRTSHGSTLSRVVHSWVLARLDRERSWTLFSEALESDVADIQGGTTQEGIHLGAMAGTVDLLQRGYTGLEARGDSLVIDPVLPEPLEGIEFSLHYRNSWNIDVSMRDGELLVTVPPSDAGPIVIESCGRRELVNPGESFRGRYA